MGSPISAVVDMEFFEELALESVPTKPRLWKRYVDDVLHNEEEWRETSHQVHHGI